MIIEWIIIIAKEIIIIVEGMVVIGSSQGSKIRAVRKLLPATMGGI